MATYKIHQKKTKKGKKRFIRVLVALVLIGGLYIAYEKEYGYSGQEPIAAPTSTSLATNGTPQASPFLWPTYGQAAYGESTKGVIAGSKDSDTIVPIASLAKIITVLTVLQKKPLTLGQQGPMITMTDADAALYNLQYSQNGSATLVEPGTQISQYQALQAVLMASSNNMAETLAVWAFGSNEAYVKAANSFLRQADLTKTTVVDASGFSPETKGTSRELVQLGLLYLQQPVLKEIAATPEATIPTAGLIKNYNTRINTDRILGIKVGDTDQAGRCFIAADIYQGRVTIAVVLGAQDFPIVMSDVQKILGAVNSTIE